MWMYSVLQLHVRHVYALQTRVPREMLAMAERGKLGHEARGINFLFVREL